MHTDIMSSLSRLGSSLRTGVGYATFVQPLGCPHARRQLCGSMQPTVPGRARARSSRGWRAVKTAWSSRSRTARSRASRATGCVLPASAAQSPARHTRAPIYTRAVVLSYTYTSNNRDLDNSRRRVGKLQRKLMQYNGLESMERNYRLACHSCAIGITINETVLISVKIKGTHPNLEILYLIGAPIPIELTNILFVH